MAAAQAAESQAEASGTAAAPRSQDTTARDEKRRSGSRTAPHHSKCATLPGVARHLTTIAVLLMVQGAFDLLFGLALSGVAVYVARGGTGLAAEHFPAEPTIGVVVFGPALLAAGALKVAAGIRNYAYRSPRLGLVALASCALSMANCLFAPAALALMIAGLRVYRDPISERAFSMGRQGLSREWIAASLARS
jgi:hypothetical protein